MPKFNVPLTATIEAANVQAATVQAQKAQKLLQGSMAKFMLKSEGFDLVALTVGQPTPTAS